MPHTHLGRRAPLTSVLLLPALVAGLSACGGSSSSDKARQASTSARVSTGSSSKANAVDSKLRALKACLGRNGVTLSPGAEAELNAGKVPKLPNGITRARAEALIRSCTGTEPADSHKTSQSASQSAAPPSKKQVTQLSRFAACMREHGVVLPPPKVSANGTVLDYKSVDTSSARYKRALSACTRRVLGNVRTGKVHLHGLQVPIKAVQIPGLKIHIEGLDLKGIKLAPIHVNVPAPSISAGGSAGSETSQETSQGEEPEPSEEESPDAP
jgi:hypothetical protein